MDPLSLLCRLATSEPPPRHGGRAMGRRSLPTKPYRGHPASSREGPASQSRARRGWQPPGMGRPEEACSRVDRPCIAYALLRRLLERQSRQAQEQRLLGRALLCARGPSGHGTGRAVPRRPPAPLGGVDPPGVRSRPSRLSSLWPRNAGDRLHHTALTHRPHPRPPPPAREDPSLASAPRTASGQPRLRSPPRRRQVARKGRRVPTCRHVVRSPFEEGNEDRE
jgi:hypothetical protein